MTDDQRIEPIEDQVGLDSPEAFEITTGGTSVTGKHLYADGGDGQEKEVNMLSPHAGASSTAPARSGIPSAMTQHRVSGDESDDPAGVIEQEVTPIKDRSIPVRQNLKP